MPRRAHAPTLDEASLRRDLAAYRQAARFHWHDTLYPHVCVRLPGDVARLPTSPVGMLFEEISASDPIGVDMQGAVLGIASCNVAGFTIHSAVRMGHDDAHCVIHALAGPERPRQTSVRKDRGRTASLAAHAGAAGPRDRD